MEKILVVEDERATAESVRGALETEGYLVDVRNSVEEVFENNFLEVYDLLVLDLILGNLPGDYLIDAIRNAKDDVPILVISAIDETEKIVEVLRDGADDYLTKPFDASELIARVKVLLRRHVKGRHEDRNALGG